MNIKLCTVFVEIMLHYILNIFGIKCPNMDIKYFFEKISHSF